jgi:DNA repair exonuclease SbcCD nuclease subunit
MIKLVIGDIHISDNFSVFKKVLFPFLKQLIAQYDFVKVVILGDVFDSSSLSNTTLALFKQLMLILKGFEVEIIEGNHDKIDAKVSAFDLLIHSDKIKIIKDLSFSENEIYLPYVHRKLDLANRIENIKKYIANNDYDYFVVYSHNDFNELYKFANSFISIIDMLQDVNKTVYFVNGHNHVPFFRDRGNLKILNIGNSINLNFRDAGVFNNFLIADLSKTVQDDIFKVIQNKYSIQYYTFLIAKEDDIEKKLSTLDSDNIKYVNLKILSPNIVIDSNYRDELESRYNISDISVEYDIRISSYDDKSEDVSEVIESLEIEEIFKKLNINIDEFLENNKIDDVEKIEILYFLLERFFEDKIISEENQTAINATVNKYYIMNGNDKK